MGIEEDIEEFGRFWDYVSNHAPHLSIGMQGMVRLPQEQFSAHYLELMATNRITKGWWIQSVPDCACCGKEISTSRDLRMYESKPYHPECFAETVDPDSHNEPMKKYLEMILKIKQK